MGLWLSVGGHTDRQTDRKADLYSPTLSNLQETTVTATGELNISVLNMVNVKFGLNFLLEHNCS